MENLSEQIKKLRKQKKITQEKLAEIVGVSAITVKRWEKERKPRADELLKIAEALGTTTDYLLNGESSVPPVVNEPPKNPGNNLPINNAQPESESYLDLGYWGAVADNARKVARSDDPRRSLVMALLSSAMNEFVGSEAAPIMTEKSIIGVNGNIQGDKNNVKVGTP